VNTIVQDAVDKGAKVHLGGKPAPSLGERFYEPTVLTNINESMMCYNEEIFGPVAVCIRQVSNTTFI
jgi:acyl-CoA reductase-like NAD-dependent aldehyde dehydrogenase